MWHANRGRLLHRTPGPVPLGLAYVETNPFPNLSIFYRTMLFEYPSVLSRFCFRSYSDLLSKFGEILFQEYVTEGISHPVFYGDLVYKLGRVRCEANFVSSGSKIVKRLRRRKYDPLIIERTIGLVLGPSTALYRSFLEYCTLTNKALGTIWRDLSKPLIVSWDSFSPWTWARFQIGGA